MMLSWTAYLESFLKRLWIWLRNPGVQRFHMASEEVGVGNFLSVRVQKLHPLPTENQNDPSRGVEPFGGDSLFSLDSGGPQGKLCSTPS